MTNWLRKVVAMKWPNWAMSPQAAMTFGLILVVLLVNCIIVHRNTVALRKSQVVLNLKHDLLQRSRALHSSLCEAESNALSYTISGEASFLETYKQLVARIHNDEQVLRETSSDHLIEKDRLSAVIRRVDERLSQLQSVIDTRTEKGLDLAREQINVGRAKDNMVGVRDLIDEIQLEQDQLIANESHHQDDILFILLAANSAAIGIGTGLTIVAWSLVERDLRTRRLAEANAHFERQNLWVTLTSIADGVIVVDATGKVKMANPVARQLMGDPGNVIDRMLSDVFLIVDDRTREPVESLVDQALAQEMVVEHADHAVLVRADGQEIPIEQSAAPIRNDLGEMTGVVLVFRDCSERRQVEKEKTDRDRRFRRVFETPLIGIAIGSTRGTLLQTNEAFLDLIGHHSRPRDRSNSSWVSIPFDQSVLDDAAQAELREVGICQPYERTIQRSDGSQVPVLISAARLIDDQEKIVVFATDLTQSKRTEAALRESDARFRALSECMPQKVWTARPDGQLDYLNTMLVDYSGLSSEQLVGWGWTRLIHPDDIRTHLDAWKRSLSSGEMFEIEHRVRKHTGEYRWHLVRALPVYNPDGQIAMWVGTNTDIHDQKQAEEALRQDHSRKDQFIALLAHELRNPLAPLSNAIQVFHASENEPETTAILLGIMERQVRQMTRLIDDLLDLSRITTGRMRLRCEPIEVKSVVSAAVEAVQPLITERQHHLSIKLPDQELWLNADFTRVSQILTNLLHNAAKYTDPLGKLSLNVEHSADNVVFWVRDNGLGISKEMLTKIFDVFMQVELTLDRACGGLGIGLTLVRTLVELHGGTVTASSEGIGHGSEFVVQLPMISSPPLRKADSEGNEDTYSNLPVLRVLVVDDVPASAKTLALMLKSLGQNVEVAFDGSSAIERLNHESFNLVFLDIAMPGMDGLEVARQLRSKPDLKSLTLIALTGFGQAEDRLRSRDAGFDDHLTKPISVDDLKAILERTAAPSH